MVLSSLLNDVASAGVSSQQVQTTIILLAVTLFVALFSRHFRLPYTLVLVVVGLVIGFLPILSGVRLDPNLILFLFLPILLFEGAWNVETELLLKDWLPIFLLAVPGLCISLALVAIALHWGIGLGWLLALLLGAIVSPTDPVAVIALLGQLGMSARLRTVVEGESLFNDGVGAAAYQIVLGLLLLSPGSVAEANTATFWTIAGEALWLMFGGLALGLLVGWVVSRLLRYVDEHLIEISVTFIVAYGVFLAGVTLHTSGLLAVVGAGLVMGSYGRRTGMSQRTREATQDVWEFSGYIAESLLFLLLGIQIGSTNIAQALPGILWAIGGVLVARVLMIYTLIPLQDAVARRIARREDEKRRFLPKPRALPAIWRPLLALCGLRGALSIALVLSLPTNFPQLELLQGIVFGVVLVTLLGQGTALGVLLPRWPKEEGN